MKKIDSFFWWILYSKKECINSTINNAMEVPVIQNIFIAMNIYNIYQREDEVKYDEEPMEWERQPLAIEELDESEPMEWEYV